MFPPHFRHIWFSFTSWPFLVTSICCRALWYRRDSFILALIYGIYLVFGIFSQRLIRPPLWYNLMHSYDGCSLVWLAPEYITYLIILPWNPFRRWLDRVWPALWTICYAWPLISSLNVAWLCMNMAMIQKHLYTDHDSMLQPHFIHYPRPRLVRLLLHDTRFVRKCFNFTHLSGWFRHGSHDHLEVDRSSMS